MWPRDDEFLQLLHVLIESLRNTAPLDLTCLAGASNISVSPLK